MTDAEDYASETAELVVAFIDDHPELLPHADVLAGFAAMMVHQVTQVVDEQVKNAFAGAADSFDKAADKPGAEKQAAGLRMAARVLRQQIGVPVPSLHERLEQAGVSGPLSAAFDMLDDAEFDMEKATPLLVAAERSGKDPQEFARHLIKLRRAVGGGS